MLRVLELKVLYNIVSFSQLPHDAVLGTRSKPLEGPTSTTGAHFDLTMDVACLLHLKCCPFKLNHPAQQQQPNNI
ncbi:hypothetical protein V6N12_040538 [Hibiscus sabdariffa]|uniref:Uncharacterized protein n=1 Tax=Hibiscus sabdariffa TaxID=183260 RepID=A0ABR2E5Z8_9ROSI